MPKKIAYREKIEQGNITVTKTALAMTSMKPDGDKALQVVFNNPDYISLKQVRERAFSRYDVCVLG